MNYAVDGPTSSRFLGSWLQNARTAHYAVREQEDCVVKVKKIKADFNIRPLEV